MSDGVEDVLLFVAGKVSISLDIVIIISDATNILHGAHSIVRAEYRVDFIERIRSVKHLLVVADRSLGDSEPVILHFLSILSQRLTAVDAHWQVREFVFALLAGHQVVERSRHKAIEISGYLLGAFKLVHLDLSVAELSQNGRVLRNFEALQSSLELGVGGVVCLSCRLVDSAAVRDHFPVFGGNDARLVRGLQIGLIETRENDVTVIRLELSVDIL